MRDCEGNVYSLQALKAQDEEENMFSMMSDVRSLAKACADLRLVSPAGAAGDFLRRHEVHVHGHAGVAPVGLRQT